MNKLDPEIKTKIIEKEKWEQVENLAEGKIIKNDIKLLKKSVKKKESLKRKSGKEWQERVELKKSEEDRKQKKRQENIQMKKEQKKKPKERAGFQG